MNVNPIHYGLNSNCLLKIIWNCLHWCNLCILSQPLLYLKQKTVINHWIQLLLEEFGH